MRNNAGLKLTFNTWVFYLKLNSYNLLAALKPITIIGSTLCVLTSVKQTISHVAKQWVEFYHKVYSL
ncbi:hemolysin expression-modulating protein [Yersinia kristensenii ATCC 33638]|nr:hemolysin expression-modulating protein [Yersinia kristensenii ATCC 33638]